MWAEAEERKKPMIIIEATSLGEDGGGKAASFEASEGGYSRENEKGKGGVEEGRFSIWMKTIQVSAGRLEAGVRRRIIPCNCCR